MAYFILFLAQLSFTVGDTWKKLILNASGFSAATLVKPAFLATVVLYVMGFLFATYTMSKIDMSRTIMTMGMMAVIFSAVAGALVLKEHFSPINLVGVGCAVVAIILFNWR